MPGRMSYTTSGQARHWSGSFLSTLEPARADFFLDVSGTCCRKQFRLATLCQFLNRLIIFLFDQAFTERTFIRPVASASEVKTIRRHTNSIIIIIIIINYFYFYFDDVEL